MFGWFSAPAARASVANRSRASGPIPAEVWMTLMATSRPMVGSQPT